MPDLHQIPYLESCHVHTKEFELDKNPRPSKIAVFCDHSHCEAEQFLDDHEMHAPHDHHASNVNWDGRHVLCGASVPPAPTSPSSNTA